MTSTTFSQIPSAGLTESQKNAEIAALEARLAEVREAPVRVLPKITRTQADTDMSLGGKVLVALTEGGASLATVQRFGEDAYSRISRARHSYDTTNRQADIAGLAAQHGFEIVDANDEVASPVGA